MPPTTDTTPATTMPMNTSTSHSPSSPSLARTPSPPSTLIPSPASTMDTEKLAQAKLDAKTQPQTVEALPLPSDRDPRNWSRGRKWFIALVVWNLIGPIDMTTTFYGGAQDQIQHHFGTSKAVTTLGTGLVNLGFALGPLIAAPLSELIGRQPVYIGSAIGFTAFSVGVTVSQSMTSLLVCRFLAGLLSSAVFSNFGGTLADLFTPNERSSWVALFSLMLQGAPTIGPVPGNLMGEHVHWRWVLALIAIWGAVCTVPTLILPETEGKAIRRKVHKGSPLAQKGPGLKEVFSRALLTPVIMLAVEPILLLTSLYHAFVYAMLFILLEAYPIVFRSTYDFSFGQAGMVFIAPFIGNVLGVALYFGYFKPAYTKKEAALKATNANIIIPPEARLPGVLVSATLVPIGMFWFALTARKSINPFVPIASGIPVGAGMTLLQLSLANYYIDLYPTTSASALAGNVTMRNLLGTVFPVIATPLYEALGNRNASLLLAGISVLGVPAGVVLVYFGKRIRKRSRWAKKDDLLQAQEMATSASGGSATDEKKPSHVPQRPDALVRGDSAGYPEEMQQPLGAKPGEQTGETERVTTRP